MQANSRLESSPRIARSASGDTQPTAAPQDRSSEGVGDARVTARERVASGARRPYDSIAETMLGTGSGVVVSFDYSSLVLLELLRRQQERDTAGEDPIARIDAVFIVNGGCSRIAIRTRGTQRRCSRRRSAGRRCGSATIRRGFSK
jgi:hypothetical protein